MKNNLGTKIYEGVRRDIVTGKYPPNSFLSEGQIASEYGVSKAPVRTALHRLCDDGYLISYARKGYLVTNTSSQDFSRIQQVRYALESLSVLYLILYASETDIRELRDIAALDLPTEKEYTTVNAQFHMAMAKKTNNRFLIQTLDFLFSDLAHVHPYLNTKNLPPEDQSCHSQLLDAIKSGDREQALRWLQKDMEEGDIKDRYAIIPFFG